MAAHTLIYGTAFRDDDYSDPRGGVRVYRAGGAQFLGYDSSDMEHVCSDACLRKRRAQILAAGEGFREDDYRGGNELFHALVGPEFDNRDVTTIDVSGFDPGDDPYVVCAVCGDVMIDDMEEE